jgi:PRTRC genetic system protein C
MRRRRSRLRLERLSKGEENKEIFLCLFRPAFCPRIFSYMGLQLADPDPALTPEQVRDAYAAQYPEITTAVIEGPDASGDKLVYKLTRAIGTKG